MDEKDAKQIAEIVASAMDSRASALASRSRLEPHDRHVTARECEVKHGQVMTVLKAQTGKMEAVHEDVKGMQVELSETTRKINGHVNWHEGMREERSDASIKKQTKWTALGTVAKWVAIGLTAATLLGGAVYSVGKISALAEEVAAKVNHSPVPGE